MRCRTGDEIMFTSACHFVFIAEYTGVGGNRGSNGVFLFQLKPDQILPKCKTNCFQVFQAKAIYSRIDADGCRNLIKMF